MIGLERKTWNWQLGYARREQWNDMALLRIPSAEWPEKDSHMIGDFIRYERRAFRIAVTYAYSFVYTGHAKRKMRLCL